MEAYKNKIAFNHEVDATIAFCKRLNAIIDIMNSRTADTGLQYNSEEYKVEMIIQSIKLIIA